MKNLRHLLLAASVTLFATSVLAQTGGSAGTTSDPNAPYSSDPFVQKRQADKLASDEYKARKKQAKKKMKEEKKAAKSEMKAEKKVASEERKDALSVSPK
jgi:hypothetical protein